MSALGYVTTKEVIVGWRCWRVLRYTRLDGRSTYRLCAVGTFGVPKVWEPRRATEAVCSQFTSEHASPWPDCECGIWALDRPEDARRRMIRFMQTQGGDPAGWAWGKVSLWGRAIEHHHGWRGQFAYPFAITVESASEDVARVLRAEYAVDVDWAGGELMEKVLAKLRAAAAKAEERERARERVNPVRARLKAGTEANDAVREAAARKREEERHAEEDAVRQMSALPSLDDLTVDEVLIAAVTSIVGWHQALAWTRETSMDERMGEVRLLDASAVGVAQCVLYARGEQPPFWVCRSAERPGFKEARRAVLAAMRTARDAGYLAYGLPFQARHSHSSGGDWFITRRGLTRVARTAKAVTVPYYDHRGSDGWRRHDVDIAGAVRLLRRYPRPPFVEEVESQIPTWMAERRAARRRSQRAYREWLQAARATRQAAMLWFTDEEVLTAARRIGKRVRQVDLMDELAPAESPGDRLQGEVARLSQQLVRLARDERLTRHEEGSKIVWSAVGS